MSRLWKIRKKNIPIKVLQGLLSENGRPSEEGRPLEERGPLEEGGPSEEGRSSEERRHLEEKFDQLNLKGDSHMDQSKWTRDIIIILRYASSSYFWIDIVNFKLFVKL